MESNRYRRGAPDRDGLPRLSSISRFGPAALLLISVAAAAATITTQSIQPSPTSAGSGDSSAGTPMVRPAKSDPLWPVIEQWQRLRQSDRLPFADYARFLIAHPGWPGEPGLRRVAERQIQPDQTDPSLVAQFFNAFPPLSSAGCVRYAEGLAWSFLRGRKCLPSGGARRS